MSSGNSESSAGPFARDARGRTPLFDAAERGDEAEVRRLMFSLAGTGVLPQRLAFLEIRDSEGRTAADVAEAAGHAAIAELIRGEIMRMECFE